MTKRLTRVKDDKESKYWFNTHTLGQSGRSSLHRLDWSGWLIPKEKGITLTLDVVCGFVDTLVPLSHCGSNTL
jgi:hypothetical protein